MPATMINMGIREHSRLPAAQKDEGPYYQNKQHGFYTLPQNIVILDQQSFHFLSLLTEYSMISSMFVRSVTSSGYLLFTYSLPGSALPPHRDSS